MTNRLRGTIFIKQNHTKKPQTKTCYWNFILLQCDFGFSEVHTESNSSYKFHQHIDWKDFKVYVNCNSFLLTSHFCLHHEAWFHWAISTGRTFLYHSMLAFPPVKLDRVPPVPMWTWFKQLSVLKDTLSIWHSRKMGKIIRDHRKHQYLWSNKFFLHNIYKQYTAHLNTSAVT